MPGGKESLWATISFNTLLSQYIKLQSQVVSQVRSVASRISSATPGKFLLLQFSMSQVTQIGESISNVEMDDATVWITSSYADIELSRAEATRLLEEMEAFDGEALSTDASVVMTPKDATLDTMVKAQRLFTGGRQGDTESFPIGLSRKKPDRELALQSVQPR